MHPGRFTTIPTPPPRWLTTFLLIVVIVITVLILHRDTYQASELRYEPDEIEIALGAHRVAETGQFKILINNQWVPPACLPWFSILILAPAYKLIGMDPGNAIYPVMFFGVLGVFIAFLVGNRISGPWSGILAALAVFALPSYQQTGRLVMVDVPFAAATLGACWIYLHLRTRLHAQPHTPRPATFFLAGLIVAFAASCRGAGVALLLPFLIPLSAITTINQRARHTIALCIPLAILAIAQLTYNIHTFASPWSVNTHYLATKSAPITAITGSWSYLTTLSQDKFQALMVVSAFILGALAWWKRPKQSTVPNLIHNHAPIWEFLLLATGPMSLMYLWQAPGIARFQLPAMVVIICLGAATAGPWLSRLRPTYAAAIILLLAGRVTHDGILWRTVYVPYTRATADTINQHTPANAHIITSLPPAYLEYMTCRNTSRRIITFSRYLDYPEDPVITAINPTKSSTPAASKTIEQRFDDGFQARLAHIDTLVQTGQPVYYTSMFHDGYQDVESADFLKKYQYEPINRLLHRILPPSRNGESVRVLEH